MNEVATKQNTELQVSKEQQMLLPIAERYMQMFPELAEDKTFNAKQAIISMALKLKELKDKNGNSAIDVCTKESVMQVAQEALVKRLDLMKSQASLIIRGDKLMLQPQYQGNVKRALELNPFLSHFNFVPIYRDDKVEMFVGADGSYGIKSHITRFQNIGNDKIVGGYVRAIKKDGSVYMTEVMTMEQIKIAWSKSSNSSLSVHRQFPLRMVRKTILNGLCSWLINTTGEQEVGDVVYEEEAIRDGMEITVDPEQDYEEPFFEETTSYEAEEEAEELDYTEFPFEDELEEEQEQEQILTVKYYEWTNKYKNEGYEQIKGTYDPERKTVQIKKI